MIGRHRLYLAVLVAAGPLVFGTWVASANAPSPMTTWRHHLGLTMVVPNSYFLDGMKATIGLRLLNRTGHTVRYLQSGCGPPVLRVRVLSAKGKVLWSWKRPHRPCSSYIVIRHLRPGHSLYGSQSIRLRWKGTLLLQGLAEISTPGSAIIKSRLESVIVGRLGHNTKTGRSAWNPMPHSSRLAVSRPEWW